MSGWDDFDPVPVTAPNLKAVELNKLLKRTFQTEEGRKVLNWLRYTYLEKATWEPGTDASYGYFRDGQNSVVREIEQRIKRTK